MHADRMNVMGTETAFSVLAMAKELERQGRKISHFEIGDPDFKMPQNIIEAAKKALDQGFTHYTPAPGLMELREAIAQHVSQTRGIDVSAEETIVFPGAKPGLFAALFALVHEGDAVVIPNPAFPIYESVVSAMGGKNVFVPLSEENDFRTTAQDVENAITSKTKIIVLNSPHNPCGSSLTKQDVQEIAEIARKKKIMVLSDEIYSRISYDSPHYSIASEPGMKEYTILCDGFSKAYAMTGWRLGYAVAPKWLIEHMTKIGINIYSCAAAFTQKAGVEALSGPQDEVEKMVAEYKRRRDYIHSELNKMPGMSCKKPGGAFYAFPNIEKTGMQSKELMEYLLKDGDVATLHGTAFGKYGEGFLRFSYATSMEKIKEGLGKTRVALEKLGV